MEDKVAGLLLTLICVFFLIVPPRKKKATPLSFNEAESKQLLEDMRIKFFVEEAAQRLDRELRHSLQQRELCIIDWTKYTTIYYIHDAATAKYKNISITDLIKKKQKELHGK